MVAMNHFYKKEGGRNRGRVKREFHFYVETDKPLSPRNQKRLLRVLRETYEPENIARKPFLRNAKVLEVGPRTGVVTPFSTNAETILRSIGVEGVRRVEVARRILKKGSEANTLRKNGFDPMTEELYRKVLDSFETGQKREDTPIYDVLQYGVEVLREPNKQYGLAMKEADLNYLVSVCKVAKRNISLTALAGWANAISEHCRHPHLKARQKIDGNMMPYTLWDLVQQPLKILGKRNNMRAFDDNGSAIRGARVEELVPLRPDTASVVISRKRFYHVTFTAETHNHPSLAEPFQGGSTGTGGRERDNMAIGRGAELLASTALFHVGELHIKGHRIPGEHPGWTYNYNYAKPLDILVEASNGVFFYGNEVGEPCLFIRIRTGGYNTPWEGRRESLKPVIYTGGIGKIAHANIAKRKVGKGMCIVQIGGAAFPIGFCGGAASSLVGGTQRIELDFNSVQRGDGEMKKKVVNVVRSCSRLGRRNPFVCIHDQGAGGIWNVITELINPAGGKLYIGRIHLGDKTMSETQILVCEFQERMGFLVHEKDLALVKSICERENCPIEELGTITDDGIITVVGLDGNEEKPLVKLPLADMFGKIPQCTFESNHLPRQTFPAQIPSSLTATKSLRNVALMPENGLSSWAYNKVDSSVGGLVRSRGTCGPLQLPISNIGVVALAHASLVGAATAMGEDPNVVLLDPIRGARRSLAKMVLGMMWAGMKNPHGIECRFNYMGPVKLPGEGALLYDAIQSITRAMVALKIAEAGGKDSSSLALMLRRKLVKSLTQLVIAGYAMVPDIRKVISPDLKSPGKSTLYSIDLADGQKRLGGSLILKSIGQIGNDAPDADLEKLNLVVPAVQAMIRENVILAGQYSADGGLASTLVKMALAGNCGLRVNIMSKQEAIPTLFSEEFAVVIECLSGENELRLQEICNAHKLSCQKIGVTSEDQKVVIEVNGKTEIWEKNGTLRKWFEATSAKISERQVPPELAREELRTRIIDSSSATPKCRLSFDPQPTEKRLFRNKPKVAVIRDEGSNGEVEMHDALRLAGFEPWDVTMTDLLSKRITLDDFRGIVFVGGFSNRDTFGAAVGWGLKIKENRRLKKMFDRFYSRPDTFSLGICNGCQLEAFLGWVPFKNLPEKDQPRFIQNKSNKFEHRFTQVRIMESPAIMLRGMAGSIFGTYCAHGEGQLYFPNRSVRRRVVSGKLVPICYVDREGKPTTNYPDNPNGSGNGFAALTTPDGRHLAFMLHPERSVRMWQQAYTPEDWKYLQVGPWLRMFQNARVWCDETAA